MSKLTDFTGDEHMLQPKDPDKMEAERFLYEHDVVLCPTGEDFGIWVPEWIIFYYYTQWKIAQEAETGMTSIELRKAIPMAKRYNNSWEGVYYLKMIPGKIETHGPERNKLAKLEFVRDVIWQEKQKRRSRAGKIAAKESVRVRKEKRKASQKEKLKSTQDLKKDTSQS